MNNNKSVLFVEARAQHRYPELDMPKFNSQEVPGYFDLLEVVMSQDAVPKEHWYTTLRTLVVGTRL